MTSTLISLTGIDTTYEIQQLLSTTNITGFPPDIVTISTINLPVISSLISISDTATVNDNLISTIYGLDYELYIQYEDQLFSTLSSSAGIVLEYSSIKTDSERIFISVSTNTNALVIEPNGFIGISTCCPQHDLDVLGGGRFTDYLYVGTNNFTLLPTPQYSTAVLIQPSTTYSIIQCMSSLSTTRGMPLSINPAGGNVGIGTQNPLYALHVSGTSYFDNNAIFTSTINTSTINTSTLNIRNIFATSTINSSTINTSTLNVNGNTIVQNNISTFGSIAITGNNNNSITMTSNTGRFSWFNNGNPVGGGLVPSTLQLYSYMSTTHYVANPLTITQDGKIGINKSNPLYTLDVNGTSYFNNNAIFTSTINTSTINTSTLTSRDIFATSTINSSTMNTSTLTSRDIFATSTINSSTMNTNTMNTSTLNVRDIARFSTIFATNLNVSVFSTTYNILSVENTSIINISTLNGRDIFATSTINSSTINTSTLNVRNIFATSTINSSTMNTSTLNIRDIFATSTINSSTMNTSTLNVRDIFATSTINSSTMNTSTLNARNIFATSTINTSTMNTSTINSITMNTNTLNADNIFATTNIGIGTTFPNAKLHIRESNVSNTQGVAIKIENKSNTNTAFALNNNTFETGIVIPRNNVNRQIEWHCFDINGPTSIPFVIKDYNKIGINNTNPQYSLDVSGNTRLKTLCEVNDPNTCELHLVNNTGSFKFIHTGSSALGNSIASTLHLYTSSGDNRQLSVPLSITKDGKIGIKIDNPQNTLDISSDIAITNTKGRYIFYNFNDTNNFELWKRDINGNQLAKPIVISDNNNIGIYNQTPQYTLDVGGESRIKINYPSNITYLDYEINSLTENKGGLLIENNSVNQYEIDPINKIYGNVYGSVYLSLKTNSGYYKIFNSSTVPLNGLKANSLQIRRYNTSNTYINTPITILENGNIGIHNDNPRYTLDINGVIQSRAGGIILNGGNNSGFSRPAITAGVKKYEINSVNSNDIGTETDGGFLMLSAGGAWSPDAKSYIQIAGHGGTITEMDHNIVFGTNGNEKMRIIKNGNVGINNTNPQYTLDISGTIRATNVATSIITTNIIENNPPSYNGKITIFTGSSNTSFTLPSIIQDGYYYKILNSTTSNILTIKSIIGTTTTNIVFLYPSQVAEIVAAGGTWYVLSP